MGSFIKNRRFIWGILIAISVLATLSDVLSGKFNGVNAILGAGLIVFSVLGFILRR